MLLSLALVGVMPANAAEQPIKWKPCAGNASAECGTLRLPIDWSKPDGAKFDLAVARHKATGSRIGALVVNEGYPGQSGVELVESVEDSFSPEILQRFDVVGFDRRGVGASQPVLCGSADGEPGHQPANQAEFDRLLAFNKKFSEECRKHTGPMYDHLSAKNVARDMDALRVALGERKISYYGHAYATLFGQHYAEMYGDKIRAMVLDSSTDHSVNAGQYMAGQARASRDAFDEFAKWCDRTKSCALHGQDVGRVMDGLLAKADRGELVDPNQPGRPKVDATHVSLDVFGWLTGGSFDSAAKTIRSYQTGEPLPPAVTAADEPSRSPHHAIYCTDFDLRVQNYREFKQLTDMEQRIAPHTRGAVFGHWTMAGCQGRGPATNPQRPLQIRNAPKILLEHSRYDAMAPYEWALNIQAQSRDTTVLVTYDGTSHGFNGRTACTTAINDRYLVDLQLPKNNTHCPAVVPDEAERPRIR